MLKIFKNNMKFFQGIFPRTRLTECLAFESMCPQCMQKAWFSHYSEMGKDS